MMHRIMRHYTLGLIVVLTACIQVSIETWEVAALHLNANTMAGWKKVASGHGLQRDFVHLASLHPYWRLVISVAIAKPLDRLVQIVCSPIRINVQHLHCEDGVFRVRRYVDIGAGFHFALVEGARGNRVAGAAHVAAVRRNAYGQETQTKRFEAGLTY
jgi:hypothetical protein